MRKQNVVFIVGFVLSVVFIFSGCTDSAESGSKNMGSAKPNTDLQVVSNHENFDVYQVTGTESFSSHIADNSIDKNYRTEFEGAAATAEFIEIQTKYLTIWKDEMAYAIENYVGVLTDDDKDAFIKLQNEWEDVTLRNLDFETQILNETDGYRVHLGSNYQFMRISAYRETYRQRTMQIKYMHYLLETQVPNGKALEECASLMFKNS